MSFTPEDIKKVAHLARLNLSENDVELYTPQLANIMQFIEQMNQVPTESIKPLSHSLDVFQRLRPDIISEQDTREKQQTIAPLTEAGLYLVPKVIE